MAKPTKNKPLNNSTIPDDWEVIELGLLGKFSKGKGILKEQVIESGLPCIRYGEIYTTHDFIISKFKSFINEDVAKESQEIKKGDILFAGSGEKLEEIGKAVAFIGNEKAFAGGDVIILSANKKVNVECLSYTLESNYVRKQKRRLGQGHSVVHIYPSDLATLKIPLPPLSEQKSIANILSLMDTAIGKTNSLIAKKLLLKKWLMQNLLTGKKKLLKDKSEAENNKWITVKLGDVFEFVKTYSISREGLSKANNDNLIYCIHYGDIHAFYENEFLDFSTQQSIPQIIDEAQPINERDYLKDGDIIMADASEDHEGVGEVVEVVNLDNKIAVGGLHTIVLRGNNEIIVNGFSGYLFSGEVVRNRLRKLATGSSVYSVTKTTLQNLSLIIPGSLKEQTAIANVLQAADKEIQLLKAKRDKLKEKKKGLMQILLTGKKRLKTK